MNNNMKKKGLTYKLSKVIWRNELSNEFGKGLNIKYH